MGDIIPLPKKLVEFGELKMERQNARNLFEKNLNMIIKHSKNGWSTVELMKCYLKTLSELCHGQSS